MKDARKLFRLFKSFKEYAKLLEVLAKSDLPLQDLVLQVITRVGFLLYWIFDNLAILSKLKIVDMDTKSLGKRGSTFWFIALLSTLILTLKNIMVNLAKINSATQYFPPDSDWPSTARACHLPHKASPQLRS